MNGTPTTPLELDAGSVIDALTREVARLTQRAVVAEVARDAALARLAAPAEPPTEVPEGV